MKYLFILDGAPYGSEKTYNALRLIMSLMKNGQDPDIRIFLLGDATVSAVHGQKTPDGFYNLERMLRGILTKKAVVKACGTCLDARGIGEELLIRGVRRGTMNELASWTADSDRVLTF